MLARNQGTVKLAPDVTLVVEELVTDAEYSLRSKLRSLARDSFGPGSFYANILPVAKWARDRGEHADANMLVSQVAGMIASKMGASEDATEVYRQSPDGLAWEIFFRTRNTHPDVSQKEIRAVINEVNAIEVFVSMMEAIAPKALNTSTPSSS